MKVQTRSDLEKLRAEGLSTLYPSRPRIGVGLATCGLATGAAEVYDALRDEAAARGLDLMLIATGCLGYCQQEPLVDVTLPGQSRILYAHTTAERARALIAALAAGELPADGALAVIEERNQVFSEKPGFLEGLPPLNELPFYVRQQKIVLRNSGLIDPTSIEEYAARGGYQALAHALLDLAVQKVIDEVLRSGLRGRGGAGFPTGRKWQICHDVPGQPKYVICNGDEGDPGAYMDRTVLESDPYSVIEGLTIAGYAIGAHQGYIYVRDEYPLAVERVTQAVGRAEELGLLGENIFDSGFDFSITIVRGAGAFVCGEETALIASIEGGLGEPRPRPPFPAISGLWGKPTVINNVKTLATVPVIISQSADGYASIGADGNTGTVVFSLVGKVANTGLVEVPLGTALGALIEDIGGGGLNGKQVKAVQTGGPSGGCLPASLYNLPITYENMTQAGSIMGSGGMVVLDEDTCMVDVARYFLRFTTAESCGKCTPCREGTRYMHQVLTRFAAGEGALEDVGLLEEVAMWVKAASLCGLGQTAPNPVLSTLRYFRDEYIAHIVDKRCPAGVCKPLVRARCANACLAEVDVPGWLTLVAQGRYAEAIEVHRRRNPFVLICGRVCPAFCEQHCRRGEVDEPVAIRQAKRFMADHEMAHPWTPPKLEEPKAKRVAVVGSGPAGLTAALRLAQKGYPVTIFERLPVLGGMMAVGIPTYRLPREILNCEIEGILRAGIEVRTGVALGRDFTIDSLLAEGYQAVILAIGAHQSRALGVVGEDLEGVYPGVDFLRDVALGNPPDLTGKVIGVVGGGDVAIDAARSAWRLGAREVHLFYRRRREDMPAHAEQAEAAEAEGVIFHFLTTPIRVIGNPPPSPPGGGVGGVECQRQALGEFDLSGRRQPMPIAGSEFTLDLDVLIPAIGQEVGLEREDGLERNRDTTLVVNEAFATTREGVFAAGDVVSGPATVIHAVAQGNKVASVVDHYLRTGRVEKIITLPGYEVIEQKFNLEDYAEARRPPMPVLPIALRRGSFQEVELGMDEYAIQEECKRCLRCDLEWLREMELPLEPRPEVTTQAVIASEAKQSPSRKEEIASSQKTLLAMTRAEQLRPEGL
jgi:NADH-quinone oxidoreductase subunit F